MYFPSDVAEQDVNVASPEKRHTSKPLAVSNTTTSRSTAAMTSCPPRATATPNTGPEQVQRCCSAPLFKSQSRTVVSSDADTAKVADSASATELTGPS